MKQQGPDLERTAPVTSVAINEADRLYRDTADHSSKTMSASSYRASLHFQLQIIPGGRGLRKGKGWALDR